MGTKFLNQSEGRIAYDDTGSGPLVVCVPGMGDLRLSYRHLILQLVSAGYRVVSMDLRGHGDSSTGWQDYTNVAVGSDMLALIRELDAGPAILIGNSMAAGAAVWAAAEAPELVAGLVLIGPSVRGNFNRQTKWLLRGLFARPWGPAMWSWYFNKLFTTRKPADLDAYRAGLRRNLAEPGRIESLARMMVSSQAAAEERLPRVVAPALVVMGSKDPDFEPETEARFVASSLRAPYHMIEGAGHYPHVEMPEVTLPLILSFLQSLKEKSEKVHVA